MPRLTGRGIIIGIGRSRRIGVTVIVVGSVVVHIVVVVVVVGSYINTTLAPLIGLRKTNQHEKKKQQKGNTKEKPGMKDFPEQKTDKERRMDMCKLKSIQQEQACPSNKERSNGKKKKKALLYLMLVHSPDFGQTLRE
jgi:hypothetical protein